MRPSGRWRPDQGCSYGAMSVNIILETRRTLCHHALNWVPITLSLLWDIPGLGHPQLLHFPLQIHPTSLQLLLYPDLPITNPAVMQELLAWSLQPPKAHHEASLYYNTFISPQKGRDGHCRYVPRVRVRCRQHTYWWCHHLMQSSLTRELLSTCYLAIVPYNWFDGETLKLMNV